MSDPWRPLFSTSVAKHGRVIAYTIVLVRAVLMTVLFFGGCIVGLAFSLWKWRDPSVPATLSHFYAPIACWLAGVRVIRQSWEITQRDASAVFVANQQAVFDLAAFGDPLPPKCVSANKSELKWYPFLGCFLHASGGVWVDRKRRAPAVAALDEAVERLKASEISLFIYPEGTRNPAPESLLPFKKGAFHTAIKSGRPIVPLVCSSQKLVMDPAAGFWPGGTLIVRALEPIETTGLTSDKVDELLQTTRTRMQAALDQLNAEARQINNNNNNDEV